MNSNARVVVTGASGFIGSNIIHALFNAGVEAHAFVRERSNLWRLQPVIEKIHLHYVDLLDEKSTVRSLQRVMPTDIIHAAVYGGYPFQKDAATIIRTNAIGFQNILTALELLNGATLINLGSSSEYGFKQFPMRETDLLEPYSIYGASKAAATIIGRAYALEHGLKIHTLRLFSPYGYWEEPSRLIPSAIVHALKNKDFHMTAGTQGRDFIFIEDVARVIIKTDFSALPPGGVYNLGAGIEVNVYEVVRLIFRLVHTKGKIIRGSLQARGNDSKTPWRADMSLSSQALSVGRLTPLAEGLSRTIKWINEHMEHYTLRE